MGFHGMPPLARNYRGWQAAALCKGRMAAAAQFGFSRVPTAMRDPKQNADPVPAPAESARQEGAQGRTKTPGDKVSDGEIDASDPKAADIADQVHANA